MSENLKLMSDTLILSRLLLCALGFSSLGLSVFETESLNHTMLNYGGVTAKVIVLIAAVMNLIALIDTVINDMLPPEYTTIFDRRIRHLVWSGLACIWMIHTFVLLKTELSYWLAVVYFIYAVGCMSIAILDTVYEKFEIDERSESGWKGFV